MDPTFEAHRTLGNTNAEEGQDGPAKSRRAGAAAEPSEVRTPAKVLAYVAAAAAATASAAVVVVVAVDAILYGRYKIDRDLGETIGNQRAPVYESLQSPKDFGVF